LRLPKITHTQRGARVKNTLLESFIGPRERKMLSRPCRYLAHSPPITLMDSQKPFFH